MELVSGKNNRIYAFDQLRALMMMLGLVVHISATYVVRDISATWPVKDVLSTSLIFDTVAAFVHAFRMPLFFMVSGFFTAMLFFERGAENMLRNRLKRIFYPFVIGLIILYPAYLFAVNYFLLRTGEKVTPVMDTLQMKLRSDWGSLSTIHLWFLYYLAMYCLAGWVLGRCAPAFPGINKKIKNCFTTAFNLKWAPFVFAPVTFLCLVDAEDIVIGGADLLRFDLNCFVTHGYFFLFGWLVYLHQDHLGRFLKHDRLFVTIGLCLFFLVLFLLVSQPGLEKSNGVYLYYLFDAIIPWCFIFGFTGLSLRYLNHYSVVGRYTSDASYWVYLLHLPLLIYFQGLLVTLHLHGLIKFVIVLIATVAVLMIGYNYLVRGTFIGKFLSGKKLKRGFPKGDIEIPAVATRSS